MDARDPGVLGGLGSIDLQRRGMWFLEPRTALLLISILLLGATVVVHLAEGWAAAGTHLLYLPIVLAAFAFQARGGMIAALVAALIAFPHDLPAPPVGLESPAMSWLLLLALFTLAGVVAGELAGLLERRLDRIDEAYQQLAAAHARSLRGFATLVEVRDEMTGSHCERVAGNSRLLGAQLGLDEVELELLYWAGLLHDLGKFAVPERILLKAGPLTGEELERVRVHPGVGADLVQSIAPPLARIAEGIRSHHERWDGRGYPDGLAGESIPIFGRILAVVDNFEALTSARPYRDALHPQEALAFLERESALAFDPAIIPVFVNMFTAGLVARPGQALMRAGPPLRI